MIPPADNPYAPPAIDEAAGLQTAPAAFGWRIENGKLWLNEQSLLPMVDPLTGETSERMTMVPVKILFRPRWLWVFPIVGAIAGGMADPGQRPSAAGFGLLIGLVILAISGLITPSCKVRVFLTGKTFRRRRNFGRLVNVMFLIAFVGPMVLAGLNRSGSATPEFAFGGGLVGMVLTLAVRRRLVCNRKTDTSFEIRHVHPVAIRELSAIQERERGGH